MPESTELSVPTVVALVLGGVAAVVLAGAVAGKEPNRVKSSGAGAPAGATTQPPRGSAAPSAEIEIPAELLYPAEAATPPSDAEP